MSMMWKHKYGVRGKLELLCNEATMILLYNTSLQIGSPVPGMDYLFWNLWLVSS